MQRDFVRESTHREYGFERIADRLGDHLFGCTGGSFLFKGCIFHAAICAEAPQIVVMHRAKTTMQSFACAF